MSSNDFLRKKIFQSVTLASDNLDDQLHNLLPA